MSSEILDRGLVMDAVRVTEIAAIAAWKLVGRGDEMAADQAAVDAMRTALNDLNIDGEIVMINPLCGALLMPLSQDGGLSNLFHVLENVAPDLPHRVRAFKPLHGKVCDALHLQIDSGLPGRRDPQVLSLTLLKLDDERLMAVIDDVSVSV